MSRTYKNRQIQETKNDEETTVYLGHVCNDCILRTYWSLTMNVQIIPHVAKLAQSQGHMFCIEIDKGKHFKDSKSSTLKPHGQQLYIFGIWRCLVTGLLQKLFIFAP